MAFICISLIANEGENPFYMFIVFAHLEILFCEVSAQVLCIIFYWFVCLCFINLQEFFIYSGYEPFVGYKCDVGVFYNIEILIFIKSGLTELFFMASGFSTLLYHF